jgi:large subunit ribosomal protein L13
MTAKTYTLTESDIERNWYVVDATDQTLGRLASRIARVLEGKHKPDYAMNLDSGDHVIVLNAAKVAVTRDKRDSKIYVRHSGYPQGLREETLGHLLDRRPEEAIRRAVKGMLPRTKLGTQQLRKLKVYAGSDHPHTAQRPQPLDTRGAR